MPLKLFVCLMLLGPVVISDGRGSAFTSCSYSSLWGRAGEKWMATGRLPDFSYAGYHAGEKTIPNARAK